MGAVWMCTRREVRARRGLLALLMLLVAFGAGTVMALVAGARRNDTAYERLLAASLPADVMALPNEPGFDWDAVRALPQVETVGEFAVTGPQVVGLTQYAGAFPLPSPEMFDSIERGVVLEGRRFDPARADEVMITHGAKAAFGLDVGDVVTLRVPPADRVDELAFASELPDGSPEQRAAVVGVLRTPFGGGNEDTGSVLTTPAFWDEYGKNMLPSFGYVNALVRLRPGTEVAEFQQAIDEVAGRPVELFVAAEGAATITNSTRFEALALLAFALAALLAAVVLVGQTLARGVGLARSEGVVLGGLGLTRGQRAAVAATGPAAAAGLGALGAVAFAWWMSDRFPIGVGRSAEPDLGRDFDAAVLVPLAALVLVAVVVAPFLMAARRPRVRAQRVRPTAVGRVVRALRPVPAELGAGLALEPGRGSRAVPAWGALAGATFAVFGVVGVLTFRAALDRATLHPDLFGQNFDLGGGAVGGESFPDDALAAVSGDRDVAMVNDSGVAIVGVGDRGVPLWSLDPVKGDLELAVLDGRAPAAADELMLGPNDRDELGLDVGDELVTEDGVRFDVVGVGLIPAGPHNAFDEGAVVTAAGLDRAAPERGDWKFHILLVDLHEGADVDAAVERLNGATDGALGFETFTPPGEQHNLRTIRTVPLALAGFLVVLAIGAVGYTLAAGVQRRRHEIVVLRALGMTPGQTRGIVAAQATTVAVVAVAIGVPLGVVAGRLVWRALADATPIVYVSPVRAGVLALVALVALVGCNLLAVLPAWRAARQRPAAVLRVE